MAEIDKNYNNNDDAISSLEQDKLDRKGKVENIVKCIATESGNTQRKNSYVIAILGEWGSGKSSVINLIKEKMKQSKDTEKIDIIEINPWHFDSKYNLNQVLYEAVFKPNKFLAALLFFMWLFLILPLMIDSFDFLRGVIKVFLECLKIHKWSFIWSAVVSLWIVNKFIKPSIFYYLLNNPMVDLISYLRDGNYTALENLKEYNSDKLHTRLREHTANRKILVIIDDIDRLKPEEVNKVFDLVKGIWNIPRITYLLAFDYEVVTNALDKIHHPFGKQYLHKFIQYPERVERAVTLGLVKEALKEAGLIPAEGDNIPDYIVEYISNVRILKKIIVQIKKYDDIKENLFFRDMLLISIIKLIDPTLCSKLIDNQNRLGYISVKPRNPYDDKTHMDSINKQKIILDALSPMTKDTQMMLAQLFGNGKMDSIFNSIANMDYFDCYFDGKWREHLVSKQELERLKEARDNSNTLYAEVQEIMSTKSENKDIKWLIVLMSITVIRNKSWCTKESDKPNMENYFFVFARIYKDKKLYSKEIFGIRSTLAQVIEEIQKNNPTYIENLKNISAKEYNQIFAICNNQPVSIFTELMNELSDIRIKDLVKHLNSKYAPQAQQEVKLHKAPD